MNRRDLLKGLAGIGAGLILPPTLAENAEAVRRYWTLDQTMLGGNGFPVRTGDRLIIEIGSEITPMYRAFAQALGAPYATHNVDGTFTYTITVERPGGVRYSLV